jgi:hypothetical protein
MSTFLVLQQELADRTRFDQTVSADATKLKRWLNMAQNFVCGKQLWPFMLAEEFVQTVTDITTGTVSINAGDTALTFSSAPTVSVANRYIKLSSSNDWYKITAHTASSTSATISPAYVGTSALSAGTYTVRKLLYSTTTPLIQILDMKQLTTPIQMMSLAPRGTDFLLPLYYDAGTPYWYVMSSPASDGTPQFSFLSSPSTVMNIMVRGMKALTDMSADTDVPVIPAPWHYVLVHIAAWYAFTSLDDDLAATEYKAGVLGIEDMARVLSHDLGRHRVMQPSSMDSNFGLQWSLPSDFGPWVSR